MELALYGEDGFYRRGERPAEHFRTSVSASSRFTSALARLLGEVDEALGRPDRLDVVDVGAGCAGILRHLLGHAGPDLAERLRPIAVEVAPRPDGLPDAIEWRSTLPESVTGLVIANEWLDNVPLDVVEQTDRGPRLVEVCRTSGTERLGPPPTPEDLDWAADWWPLTEPGDRAEIGHPRCRAWAAVVERLDAGLAVAMDYAHTRTSRPPYGSLTGYRDGATVAPVPDGSCDITAHVALDACAAAGERAGANATLLTTQRDALRALGLTGARPPLDLAHSDPRAYLVGLRTAGEEAELLDASGLGGFGWLAQSVGMPLPPSLAGLRP
ncbi:hypothetical protein DZF91_36595 [Actinomadura logoneensis]|uniref:SAM-dependent methyltransferase n=2 Tax=Actinomadura logoneensis TaxID=2293572 RepID=A0A372J9M1_9ACTN|nr:hypothetical protein DZF91_36595 [Actinomadura logoneensis]